MARIGLVLALLLPVFLGADRASAHDRPKHDKVAQARHHFDAGRAHFEASRFKEAIDEFEAGYRLAPRPMFLANIGQAYRQLFEFERALDAYRAFLAQAPADDPLRPEVERVVSELSRALEARKPAPPPTPPSEPAAAPPAAAPPSAVTPAPVELRAATPPPPKRGIRRYWWIIPVATVAAVGLGIGIYFAVSEGTKSACDGLALGCVELP